MSRTFHPRQLYCGSPFPLAGDDVGSAHGKPQAVAKSTGNKVSTKRARLRPPEKSGGSLARGFHILQVLVEATRPLTSAEIAHRCGFDPSTAHRLVQALVSAGYVLRDQKTKRYIAGPRVLFPLPLYHPWNVIRRDAMPALSALRDQLGSTVGFVAFCFGQRVLLELAPGRDPLSPDYKTWLSSPLHASGSGKILLMAKTPAERRELLGSDPFERFTDHTTIHAKALDDELAESSKRGYVLACDDYILGFRVVAAPIRSADSTVIGCFFSSGRASGFPDERLRDIGLILIQAADLFSRTTPSLRGIADFLGSSGES